GPTTRTAVAAASKSSLQMALPVGSPAAPFDPSAGSSTMLAGSAVEYHTVVPAGIELTSTGPDSTKVPSKLESRPSSSYGRTSMTSVNSCVVESCDSRRTTQVLSASPSTGSMIPTPERLLSVVNPPAWTIVVASAGTQLPSISAS